MHLKNITVIENIYSESATNSEQFCIVSKTKIESEKVFYETQNICIETNN